MLRRSANVYIYIYIYNIFCRYGKIHFTNASALAVKYGTRRAKPAGSE